MNADKVRDRLTTELADLDDRARFAAEARADSASDPNDEGALGQHPGDHGSETAAVMDGELLVDTIAEQRRHVTAALTRLDEGTYGRCAVCDKEIDDERLDARPETLTCREHADSPVVV